MINTLPTIQALRFSTQGPGLSATDEVILAQFRAHAKSIKEKFAAENMDQPARLVLIREMMDSYLIRLKDNGWSQRDRIVILAEIWNQSKS